MNYKSLLSSMLQFAICVSCLSLTSCSSESLSGNLVGEWHCKTRQNLNQIEEYYSDGTMDAGRPYRIFPRDMSPDDTSLAFTGDYTLKGDQLSLAILPVHTGIQEFFTFEISIQKKGDKLVLYRKGHRNSQCTRG